MEDGALNVVVVGGGPTGVESAGALAELYRSNLAKDYPSLPQDQARLILVEAGPELFSMFKPDIRKCAKGALEKRGVEVLLGEMVASVAPTRVTLKSGTELQAHTLVWGAGLQGSPIAESLGLELERGNRVRVEPDLSLAGHPEVFVVGDAASITDSEAEGVLPQLGSVALQSGERAGENIARLVAGKETEPFEYHDKGTMATIGRGAAVAVPPRTDDEGQDGIARLGRRPPQAPADRRRQGQGSCGLVGQGSPMSAPPGSRCKTRRGIDAGRDRGVLRRDRPARHEPLLEHIGHAALRSLRGQARRALVRHDREGRCRGVTRERPRRRRRAPGEVAFD